MLFGLIVGLLLPDAMRAGARALFAWNAALLCYFAFARRILPRATHATIRHRAQRLDEGRSVMLLVTTIAACASIGAIIVELGGLKQAAGLEKPALIALTVLTVLDSWLFMHLTFALHYAHEFYAEASGQDDAAQRGGLHFPATAEPLYIDFLYFSYVIGCACATADVDTTSAPMRKIALVHGVVAFFYNTTVLALMVNIGSQFVG